VAIIRRADRFRVIRQQLAGKSFLK
jgi:hypothetical protein